MSAAVSLVSSPVPPATIPCPPPERSYERIVVQYAPLVHSVARRFRGRSDHDDLVQEGFLGLMLAVDTFDDERDSSFWTWARLRIRAAVYRAARKSDRRGLSGGRGLDPSLGRLLACLDAPSDADGEGSMHERIGRDAKIEEEFASREERACLRALASAISARHRQAIDGVIDGLSYGAIGATLSVSKQRVQQMVLDVTGREWRHEARRLASPPGGATVHA